MRPTHLAAALAAVLAGCTVQAPSVTLSAICFPTDDCKFGNTCANTLLGNPGMNAVAAGASGNELLLFIQVDNRAPNNGNVGAGRVNTNDFHATEARIRYSSAVPLAARVEPMQATVPANGSQLIGVAVLPNGDYTTLLGGASSVTILAKVKVVGNFDDGTTFETAEMDIPVFVCSGCVQPVACTTGTASYCPASGADVGPRTAKCG